MKMEERLLKKLMKPISESTDQEIYDAIFTLQQEWRKDEEEVGRIFDCWKAQQL